MQLSLQNKLIDLRATYAALPDELSARMPLAYVQLVQVPGPLLDVHLICAWYLVLDTWLVLVLCT